MDQATKWLDLSGKVVVVTGGSMGLGEKMVENLYANGATVVYADLSPNKNFSQFDDIIFIKCDVTKKTEVEQLTASVVKRFGHIDGLVNNAGVSRPRLLVDVFKEKPEYEDMARIAKEKNISLSEVEKEIYKKLSENKAR